MLALRLSRLLPAIVGFSLAIPTFGLRAETRALFDSTQVTVSTKSVSPFEIVEAGRPRPGLGDDSLPDVVRLVPFSVSESRLAPEIGWPVFGGLEAVYFDTDARPEHAPAFLLFRAKSEGPTPRHTLRLSTGSVSLPGHSPASRLHAVVLFPVGEAVEYARLGSLAVSASLLGPTAARGPVELRFAMVVEQEGAQTHLVSNPLPLEAFRGPAGIQRLRVGVAELSWSRTDLATLGAQAGEAPALLPPPRAQIKLAGLLVRAETRAQSRRQPGVAFGVDIEGIEMEID